MSLAKIKEAAAAHDENYVTVSADELANALSEAGENPTPGSLLEHVQQQMSRAATRAKMSGLPVVYPEMSVHREKHLGKLLGVPAMPLES